MESKQKARQTGKSHTSTDGFAVLGTALGTAVGAAVGSTEGVAVGTADGYLLCVDVVVVEVEVVI